MPPPKDPKKYKTWVNKIKKRMMGNKLSLGRIQSEEEKNKRSNSQVGKHIHSKKYKKYLSNKMKGNKYAMGKFKGEKSPCWKGENVGYLALHHWLYRNFGIPYKCDNKKCIYPRKDNQGKIMLKPKRYEWANLSNKNIRNRENWVMLCVSCHRIYDKNINRNLIKL